MRILNGGTGVCKRFIARVFLGTTIILAALSAHELARAASYELRGQASLSRNYVIREGTWDADIVAGYIPQLTLMQATSKETFLDFEVSVEARASAGSKHYTDTSYVDLYRLKLRFATASTETRLGLQQINFGSAYLLRPLKWFDVLDPRDPQGLTGGVYALSFRYVTLGNSSIWLWGLYDNDEPKGYEVLPSLKRRVEYGGRTQSRILSGELAVSYQHRFVDGPEPIVEDFPEHRVGVDGRWDIVVGAWFETALTHRATDDLPNRWSSMTTLGTDYTFGMGNGLHTLLEHMIVNSSQEVFGSDDVSNVTGLSVSYPLGYIDRLSSISFYSWDNGDHSQYISWDHYWDMLSLNVSLFHYPETSRDTAGGINDPVIAGGGYGGQVLLIFNH